MRNGGRKRKRKRSSRSSRPAVLLNSAYYLLSALSQDGDSPLPGPSNSRHTDLEEQLRTDPLFLLREDVLLSDDEDSTSLKRSRPVNEAPLSNHDENRRSPQPGTSHDFYAPTEVRYRARSPSLPGVEIPSITISDEDFDIPSMTRPETPSITIRDDDDNQDELEDVIFVGVLRPPQAELQLLLALLLENDILETDNHIPANITEGLPTMILDTQNMDGQNDCRICLSDYVDGEELLVLPCLHNFHSSCVQHWLQQNPTCPMCRTGIH